MNEKKILEIEDEFGKVIKYEILCVFKLEKTGKDYIIYTDKTSDENDSLNVFASIFYPQDNGRLDPIETEEEWQEVEKILKDMQQEIKEDVA